MSLPTVALPTDKIHGVTVRGLSRGEVMELRGMAEDGNIQEFEIHLLSKGTGTDIEDARNWYDKAPSMTAQDILTKIVELSGLEEDAGKGSSAA